MGNFEDILEKWWKNWPKTEVYSEKFARMHLKFPYFSSKSPKISYFSTPPPPAPEKVRISTHGWAGRCRFLGRSRWRWQPRASWQPVSNVRVSPRESRAGTRHQLHTGSGHQDRSPVVAGTLHWLRRQPWENIQVLKRSLCARLQEYNFI